ncbi:beta-lactamase hydrolase domain-containing protein [Sedimentitalea sp. HM32M-2]|uniref:beta-lactamase hydrolase domain-containing protein n=1 Tax=Sedimentitalea sp. HM32M-2 TaxID=3351566 RepID=UPI00362DC25F
MDIRKLSPEIAVADQLKPADITQIKSLGYKSLICNRPDGESGSQYLFEAIARAAELSDIPAHYLPIPSTGPGPAQVAQLQALWPDLHKPALFYCDTGGRSMELARLTFDGIAGG